MADRFCKTTVHCFACGARANGKSKPFAARQGRTSRLRIKSNDMNKKTLHAALATIGRKGGKARAKKLTAARRIEIAREAGKASGRKRKERK